ncbi:E3 SUMO-protein ligase MMS21-like [Andrographis paniculata]|uniref:E3 SUMO-protein ligase MMS21-like n=1 Tax=Andrographis paniculata TaxID=175694 RepID=UPI0021E77677|nr:E3 SUMO-protein ligase MMS21-like [Andrographis paniculata]
MASTSTPHANIGTGRMSTAASTLYADNQTLITEIRKAVMMMKDVGIDFERDNNSEMVKVLENGVTELMKSSDECTQLSNAIQSIKNEYQPGAELTDFTKLFDEKIKRSRKDSSSVSQNQTLLRQFREAIWNVHHAGQPMPGEEQEDIVMTSSHCNLLNMTCPLTGKPVEELVEPVRSMDCKHIYEKQHIMQRIRSKVAQGQCPVSGCPRRLQADRVVCDALLLIEIEEMRSMKLQEACNDVIEDVTAD